MKLKRLDVDELRERFNQSPSGRLKLVADVDLAPEYKIVTVLALGERKAFIRSSYGVETVLHYSLLKHYPSFEKPSPEFSSFAELYAWVSKRLPFTLEGEMAQYNLNGTPDLPLDNWDLECYKKVFKESKEPKSQGWLDAVIKEEDKNFIGKCHEAAGRSVNETQ